MTNVTRQEAAEITGLTKRQLEHWKKTRVVVSCGKRRRTRWYSPQQLITLCLAAEIGQWKGRIPLRTKFKVLKKLGDMDRLLEKIQRRPFIVLGGKRMPSFHADEAAVVAHLKKNDNGALVFDMRDILRKIQQGFEKLPRAEKFIAP